MADIGTGAVFVLLLAAFWPTLAVFPGTWATSYQEHGFFVGALVAWLILRDRRRLAEGAGQPLRALLPVLAALSLAWLGAVIMNVRLVHEGVFVVLLTLWALATFGWRSRTVVLPIGLTALLGVPFWTIGVPILQKATVLASGGMTRALGIEAEIGATTVTIASGTFLIEEGCAGLNYLMGGLVLGAAYGHFFTTRWQTQLRILSVFAATSIVGNWIRVAVLIVLGEVTAMQSPYIADHLWQGWLIFTLLMLPTFVLAGQIARRDEGIAPAIAPGGAGAPLDARRFHYLAAALVAIGPILFTTLSLVPRRAELDREISTLGFSDAWTVESLPSASWMPAFGGLDDSSAWLLRSGSQTVEASRLYFVDQKQGEELIQYDNRIAPDSLVLGARMLGPVGTSRRLVNETAIIEDGTPRLVWYWYRVSGVDTPSRARAKLLEIPAFFLRTSASELVALSARCEAGGCFAAARSLASVLGAELSTQ